VPLTYQPKNTTLHRALVHRDGQSILTSAAVTAMHG